MKHITINITVPDEAFHGASDEQVIQHVTGMFNDSFGPTDNATLQIEISDGAKAAEKAAIR